jgi:hypothetical protein
MFSIILRSVCVGIAALIGLILFGLFVVFPISFYFLNKGVAPAGDGEVGWDLVIVAHNQPAATILVALLALLVFAGGFYFGFRYFSKSMARG